MPTSAISGPGLFDALTYQKTPQPTPRDIVPTTKPRAPSAPQPPRVPTAQPPSFVDPRVSNTNIPEIVPVGTSYGPPQPPPRGGGGFGGGFVGGNMFATGTGPQGRGPMLGSSGGRARRLPQRPPTSGNVGGTGGQPTGQTRLEAYQEAIMGQRRDPRTGMVLPDQDPFTLAIHGLI